MCNTLPPYLGVVIHKCQKKKKKPALPVASQRIALTRCRSKKSLNVESPSFTPASLGTAATVKKSFTSQAANAPSFTPRGIGTTQQHS